MIRKPFFQFLLLLAFSPLATVQADCPETASGHHTYLGVDVTLSGRSIDKVELLRVDLVWLPPDPESRFRDKHVIEIDWKNQTHSNVNVWDGDLRTIREWDIHPVNLASNTDFETGQVHIQTCEGVLASDSPVLMFAYYGKNGTIDQKYTRVSPLVGYSAVTNEAVSKSISDTFNNRQLAENVLEDVERATGVLPEHHLAESFLFQYLQVIIPLLDKNPALFFGLKNAAVFQDRVYVTGSDASASVPLSLAGVTSDGVDIMDRDRRVRNLEQYIGIVQFESRFRRNWIGYNHIIEARPDLKVTTTACVDGLTTLTAEFLYPSEVSGNILLFTGDSIFPGGGGEPSINQKVSCDNDYRLTGTRYLEHGTSDSGPVLVPVATKDTLIKLEIYTRQSDDALRLALGGYHPTKIVSLSSETVLKLWDAPSIESLYGTHKYFCDMPGDTTVDSIDEIASQRASELTTQEQEQLGPFSDPQANQQAWTDENGDGSICDVGEFADGLEPKGRAVVQINLAVYPPGD